MQDKKILTIMYCTCKFTEVYQSHAGCVYQCDSKNCIWIHFDGNMCSYNINQFLRLKASLEKIDLENMINSPQNSSDIEIISILGTERIYILNIPQILSLKDLLAGAMAMLELNSIIRQKLHVLTV